MDTAAWRPIVDDALHDRATAAIDDIAHTLASADVVSPTLASGSAGIALFFAHLARTRPDHEATAHRFLEHACEAVATQQLGPSLFTGFVGIAWVLRHIVGEEDDSTREIDDALLALLDQPTWPHHHGLVLGLAGIGVYALDRKHQRMLERVVSHLAALATRHDGTARWFESPADFAPPGFSDGVFDSGMSHGAAGIAALLARIPNSALLDGAVAGILAHPPPTEDARFASWTARDGRTFATAPSWCRGDLGIASALLHAARVRHDSSLEQRALEAALHVTQSDYEETDAGLCHGSAGRAHTMARLYHMTERAEFLDDARRALHRTLDLLARHHEPGLLTGRAGIGLALLAATTNIEPSWDRVFLL